MQMVQAPAFRIRHSTRKRINQWRLGVDFAGLTVIKLFGPWLWQIGWLHPVLQIYPILATFVILTVEPSRLPEFTTTRLKQREAWRWTSVWLPGLALVIGVIAWVTNTHVTWSYVGLGSFVGAVWSSYFTELFWRNILQPKLRQFGFGRIQAVALQAALFAASFAVMHQSLGVVATALVLGAFNGWVSYRYRTMWPGFVLLTVWTIIFI